MVPARFFLGSAAGALAGAILANGCTDVTIGPASSDSTSSGGPGGTGGASTTSSSSGVAGSGNAVGPGGGGSDGGQVIEAGPDALEDVLPNPCMTECGIAELCDPDHLGFDDNCNGLVDEGCPCVPSELHPCFKGDPHFHGAPGCFDGVESCGANGQYSGACAGGVHAVPPDDCYLNDTSTCHAIATRPFVPVQLKDGTGLFGQNAVPGSESWTVQCPLGVMPCPVPTGPTPKDDYKPIQSGEYLVTYTKTVAGLGQQSCTYPLFVGAPGLRVELGWEHPAGDSGVDLDLHVHEPNDTMPWAVSPPQPQDCTWSNCTFNDFQPPQGFGSPMWFFDPPLAPPQPVNWYLSPVLEENTCFFAPGGQSWQMLGLGCHNPRLDTDLISCNPLITDPDDGEFCLPENINIDYPPLDAWTRIGVHYYSSHGLQYDVHPKVRVFCNGALAAELGTTSYYLPEAPVTFTPSDGSGFGGNRFWVVADVGFEANACGVSACTVRPVYADAAARTPFFMTDAAATTTFAPAYPPLP